MWESYQTDEDDLKFALDCLIKHAFVTINLLLQLDEMVEKKEQGFINGFFFSF